MALTLVCGDKDWSILLEVDHPVCDLLTQQKVRADESDRSKLFTELVSRSFVASLKDVLGTDLRLPTNTQIDLAVLMARELAVSIPSEALKYRGAMEAFLSTNRNAYRRAWNQREAKALDWESQL